MTEQELKKALQRSYMRGYAKGRAYKKKQRASLYIPPSDFASLREPKWNVTEPTFMDKVIKFLRSGLQI